MSVYSVDLELEEQRIADVTDPSERLVRSGVLALIRSGRAILDNGLSPELISRIAGRSRRSYYDHFRGKAEFTDRVIDELLGVGGATPARIDVAEHLIDTNTGDLAKTLYLMATPPSIGNRERIDRIGRQIVTALAATDPYAKKRITDFYERDRLVYEPLVVQLFESWGLEFREPWDHNLAAVMFRVVVDGTAMRSAVDETVDDRELLLLILQTMLPSISKVADSEDDDSVLDLIRVMSDQARYHLRERRDPALVVDSRKAIHDAALSEIRARGVTLTTLYHVAESAQLSVRTVRRSVGELDDIVCDILNGYIAGLDNAAEVDLGDSCKGDPWAATIRHVHRCSNLLADWPVLTHALANYAVTGESEAARKTISKLDGVLTRLLSAAQDAGQFSETLSKAELELTAHSGVRLLFRSSADEPDRCAQEAMFVLRRCCGAPDDAAVTAN